jgi:hypothetical protein
VDNADALSQNVVAQRAEIDWEAGGVASLSKEGTETSFVKPRREPHWSKTNVGDYLQLGERVGDLGAVPAGTRQVHGEALPIKVAHEISVNRRVGSETSLRLEE